MQGPKDTTELRERLRPREYPSDPPGERPTVHLVQGPSDALRDRAYDAGVRLFALVPDTDVQQFFGLVLEDLVLIGEAKLCELHGIKTEHAPLQVLEAVYAMHVSDHESSEPSESEAPQPEQPTIQKDPPAAKAKRTRKAS